MRGAVTSRSRRQTSSDSNRNAETESTSRLLIPTDQEAEIDVAGACIRTSHACTLIDGLVSADDFYWPLHRRIFVAANRCALHGFARIEEIALLTNAEAVERFAYDSVPMWDASRAARRVASASGRRRALWSICEAHNAIQLGDDALTLRNLTEANRALERIGT